MNDLRIEPPKQARAQDFRKAQEHAAIERLKMHRQRPKRRRQGRVQADRATMAVRDDVLKRIDFLAADRRTYHHDRRRVEAAVLDQVANRAVDAGTEAVIVGAQPDTARRRGVVHSAAVRSLELALVSASMRFTLCSATK